MYTEEDIDILREYFHVTDDVDWSHIRYSAYAVLRQHRIYLHPPFPQVLDDIEAITKALEIFSEVGWER